MSRIDQLKDKGVTSTGITSRQCWRRGLSSEPTPSTRTRRIKNMNDKTSCIDETVSISLDPNAANLRTGQLHETTLEV